MLLVSLDRTALAEIRGDGLHVEALTNPQLRNPYAYSDNAAGLFVDSQKRSWLPSGGTRSVQFDGAGAMPIELGYARYEDHAGRIWFATASPSFSVLLPAGQ